MKKRTKKILKVTSLSLVSLVVVVLGVIALAINFIFTPEKLTPVVLKVANQTMNAKLDMKSVELTFFSTFPPLWAEADGRQLGIESRIRFCMGKDRFAPCVRKVRSGGESVGLFL